MNVKIIITEQRESMICKMEPNDWGEGEMPQRFGNQISQMLSDKIGNYIGWKFGTHLRKGRNILLDGNGGHFSGPCDCGDDALLGEGGGLQVLFWQKFEWEHDEVALQRQCISVLS